jgi:sphingomyelin phosphodiesterase 2
MRAAYEKGNIVLGLGDFNMIPLSLAHKIITTHGRSQDVWRLQHPDSSIGAWEDAVERKRGKSVPTAEFNLKENGTTCDSILNTWHWNKGQQQRLRRGEDVHVDPSSKDPRGKRLDYIFLGDAKGEWAVQSVSVGMIRRHPTIKCSLSDHFSVEATLSRVDGGVSLSEKGTAVSVNPQYLPVDTHDAIQAVTNKYVARERLQRKLRLGHFWIQFAVSIGCLIAVWWSPHNYVSFILMLLSTIGLSAGVLDGLIAFLFVSSELRSLKEFQWEIDNAREAARRMST